MGQCKPHFDDTEECSSEVNFDCSSIDNGCQCTNRMISALQIFSLLNVNDNEDDRDTLMQYWHAHPSLLNDYIHIVTTHKSSKDLHDICHGASFEAQGTTTCNITHCNIISRHYRDRGMIDNEVPSKHMDSDQRPQFVFCRDILDSMHCFLYHLHDVGLRVLPTEMDHKETPDIHDEHDHYDAEFAHIYDTIRIQQQKLPKTHAVNIKRFQNNKFCIEINPTLKTNATKQGKTFMVGLYEYLSKHMVSNQDLSNIQSCLEYDEYDTDAILDDITDLYHVIGSNIALQLQNNYHHSLFQKYIKQTQYVSFSIGFVFYYWPYYKKKIAQPERREIAGEINDHSGFEPHQLYIEIKYQNLKDEILKNNIHTLDMSQLQQSITKADQFSYSIQARRTKAGVNARLHYDIRPASPISHDHLLSAILYCDWSTLSLEFSTTFRTNCFSESISEIKARNREYAHWSKLLRETVQIFGQQGWEDCYPEDIKQNDIWNENNNKVRGPFFCGMSSVMAIPEFNIRLCGPTSTSLQKEVVMRFAGEEGMIIELNNNGNYYAKGLRSFNCSWLSSFNGEDERLFIGGDRRIKIVTICNLKTKQNFGIFFQSLFYFHCMLNGSRMETQEPHIAGRDHAVLDHLIQYMVSSGGLVSKYPVYIIDTFEAFVHHTTQVVINLYEINKHFKSLKSLILFDGGAHNNIFKEILFRLFGNLTHIIIYCTSTGLFVEEYEEYRIDLLLLLELMCSSSFTPKKLQITVKATHDYSKCLKERSRSRSWIFRAVSESDALKSQFKEKGVDIEVTQTMSASNQSEDWIIITKCK